MSTLSVVLDNPGQFNQSALQMMARGQLNTLKAKLMASDPQLRFTRGPCFTVRPEGGIIAEWSYKKIAT